jgi:glycosyltransferase involved in cell wall biosynthesis
MNRAPRTLYVVGNFPTLSETFVINEINSLKKLGLELGIFSIAPTQTAPPNMHDFARPLYNQTHYMPHDPFRLGLLIARHVLRNPVRAWKLWRLARQTPTLAGQSKIKNWIRAAVLAEYALQWQAEHLHGHWTIPSDLARMVARVLGLSFSFTLHAHDIYDEDPTLEAQGGGASIRSEGASFIATCTDYNRQYLMEHYGPRIHAPLHTVYHGINSTFFQPAEKNNAEPVILSVGRIIEYKGFDRLVEILNRLHQEGIAFTSYIIGSGSLLEPLRARVAELKLEGRIILTGPLPAEQVREYYAKADLFVLAASLQKGQHGLPNVLVEGMSAGLAVVTTALPPAVELIDPGVDGLIVPDDEDALHEAICRLLDDKSLRAEMGIHARQKVLDRFSLEANTEYLYRLFQSLGDSCTQESSESVN